MSRNYFCGLGIVTKYTITVEPRYSGYFGRHTFVYYIKFSTIQVQSIKQSMKSVTEKSTLYRVFPLLAYPLYRGSTVSVSGLVNHVYDISRYQGVYSKYLQQTKGVQ